MGCELQLGFGDVCRSRRLRECVFRGVPEAGLRAAGQAGEATVKCGGEEMAPERSDPIAICLADFLSQTVLTGGIERRAWLSVLLLGFRVSHEREGSACSTH